MRNMLCAWHILTLIAFDEKISGVSIKSFCLLLKIQDWPSEDYNATPVTAIVENLCISEASLHFRRPAPTWSMRRVDLGQAHSDSYP